MAARKIFGLDIGTSSIKAIQLIPVSSGAKFKLVAAGEISAPPRGMVSESQVDRETIIEAIKKLVKETKISTSDVIAALPESQIFTRVIEMPVLSDRELASAIRWEAEQYIPIPLPDVSLAWNVLFRPQNPNAEDKMEVLLIAAPLNIVEKYTSIIRTANLRSLSLETEILATTRALVDTKSPTTLIVSLGAFSTDMCIARAGVVSFTRSIATGGNALTKAIASDLSFEMAQAEEYKKNYGLLEDQLEGKILNIIKPVFEIVVGEIRKAIAKYQSKRPENQIKRTVLCGGGAKLPGVVLYLASALGTEVQVGDPWINIDKASIPTKLAEDRSIYTVATGLAMKNI